MSTGLLVVANVLRVRFQSRIAICVENDAVHAIGLVAVVQSRRQLRLFSVPTVTE